MHDHLGHWRRCPPLTPPHTPPLRQSVGKAHSESHRAARLSCPSKGKSREETSLSRRQVCLPPSSTRVQPFSNKCRWAIKEAVYKAVYPVVKPTWHDFTLQRPIGSPKPDLVYHPKDSQLLLRLGRMHTSVSHDGEYTFATVIVELPANSNIISSSDS